MLWFWLQSLNEFYIFINIDEKVMWIEMILIANLRKHYSASHINNYSSSKCNKKIVEFYYIRVVPQCSKTSVATLFWWVKNNCSRK